MSVEDVVVPRVNANEDSVLIVDALVETNARVSKGDALFVVETTKSSVEVDSPIAGIVTDVLVKRGAMVDVGSVLCRVALDPTESQPAPRVVAEQPAANAMGASDIAITAKARVRAKELGIDIEKVPSKDGRIGIEEVLAYAQKGASDVSSQPDRDQVTAAKAVIVGGGGHAATIHDVLSGSGWELVGALDPGLPIGTPVAPGLSIIGGDEMLEALYRDGVRTAFIGVGGAFNADRRSEIFNKLTHLGFYLPPMVHRSANVASDARLGFATYVMASAIVGPRCRIGSNVIVNAGSIVCHDCVVEDHVHLTPGVILAGTVRVGEHSVVGMGATALFGTTIGRRVLVHNGASVISDVPDNTVVARTGVRSTNEQ